MSVTLDNGSNNDGAVDALKAKFLFRRGMILSLLNMLAVFAHMLAVFGHMLAVFGHMLAEYAILCSYAC